MKRSNKFLRPEDRCSLPSPRLYPTRVAGMIFNFSRTTMPEDPAISTKDPSHPIRRRRPTSAACVCDPACESASAS
jgi:hypothetical protein